MNREELKDAIKKGYSIGYDDGFRAACDDMMVHLHNDIVGVLDNMKKSAKDYEVDIIDEYEEEEMKDLKFRAWSSGHNRYCDFVTLDESRRWIGWIMSSGVYLTTTDINLEQYTGLKDKNGKEIYIGDIVSEHNGDIVGEIIQKPSGEYCIAWIGIFGGSSVLYDELSMCEVIGNINENPGFLVENNGKKD